MVEDRDSDSPKVRLDMSNFDQMAVICMCRKGTLRKKNLEK